MLEINFIRCPSFLGLHLGRSGLKAFLLKAVLFRASEVGYDERSRAYLRAP